jgi:hypothetical protein
MSATLQQLRTVLDRTVAICDDDDVAHRLDRLRLRLDQPLIVALAGKVKAGKSTLLNALVGEQLAPTDAGECTRIVTWYQNGPTYRVTARLRDGSSQQLRFSRDDGALDVDLGALHADQVDRLIVEWPSSRLAKVTLVDTPGLDSVTVATSQRTASFLGIDDEEDDVGDADAIVYLMRHLHRSDLSFLEAFRDTTQAAASPINAIAVLSRSDEIGACRLDAMSSAHRVAASWRDDTRLRRLCQTVTPVAGLVAQAGASLTEDDYRTLSAIAALPRERRDELLLTVDRFVSDDTLDVTKVERELLLERLGIFGVRLSLSLVRLGAAASATALAGELTMRSGIEGLRSLLLGGFAQRRDVLKARIALVALDIALHDLSGPGVDRLRNELEQIAASAHEFAEVHLLNTVRSGALALRADETSELERLLGTLGAPARDRLGLESGVDPLPAIHSGIERWQRRAEHPMSSRDVSIAAREVVRSYEGLLASVTS